MAETFGSYTLLKRLASGGMGEVFLAKPNEPARASERLVVKRILPHLAEEPDFVDMFLRETRFAAQLIHPNLIRIVDVGRVDDSVYLAMEYVRGENVREIARAAQARGEVIPLDAGARIVAQVGRGLMRVHEMRGTDGKLLDLVHRDVSPQNILVGFDGAVKLIDFGIAKAANEAQITVTGVLRGKCSYMSPEQAAADLLDARSDLFSLGIVWWELLTGKRLFKGANDQATVRLVMDCQVPPPSRMRPGVPPALDAIAARVLAKTPAARGSVEQFVRDLEALASQSKAGAHAPEALLVRRLFAVRFARPQAEEEAGDSAALPEPNPLYQPLRSLPGVERNPRQDDEFTQTLTGGTREFRRAWAALALAAVALLVLLVWVLWR